MNAQVIKYVHLIAKGLLSALMLSSGIGYLFKPDEVQSVFAGLGFPEYIVIPLGIAKLLGVLAIWLAPRTWMKDWAYAGFFFNTVLAFSARIHAADGAHMSALVGILLVVTAFGTYKTRTANK